MTQPSDDAPPLDSAPLADPFLRLRAGDVSCPAPVFVDERATVAQAARAMARAGATAALVRRGPGGGGGEVLGILTERDVLTKVVAQDRDAATLRVEEVMTPRLVTVGADELLIEAFSRMVHAGIRRLVLVDASGVSAGAPIGILGERDMLAARGESPLALARDISLARDREELARCFARLHRVAAQSVAEGIPSQAVGRLISEMHDRILERAWLRAMGEVEQRHGPAPASHAILALGSQGRREQYLATDQDLALVHDGAPEDREAEVWFEALGERLTELVLAIGFPPCPKRIMLDNPDWRESLDGWLDELDRIAETPDGEGVVRASLLADMRPVAGDLDLGRRTRAAALARLRQSSMLLKYLAREAVRFSPPLASGIGGMFGGAVSGLAVQKDGPRKGTLDVKRGGVFPLTLGAKVLAISHGLEPTGTDGRLQALGASGVLSAGLAQGLRDAHGFLQTLRMRHQAGLLRQGQEPDNDLRPEALGTLECARLRDCFKLVAQFQDILFENYSLRMLG